MKVLLSITVQIVVLALVIVATVTAHPIASNLVTGYALFGLCASPLMLLRAIIVWADKSSTVPIPSRASGLAARITTPIEMTLFCCVGWFWTAAAWGFAWLLGEWTRTVLGLAATEAA